MSGERPAWADARSRADFMRVASTQDGAGDILLQPSYTETKNYYVSNSPLHFAGEATRSETETHRSRLGNRSWADDVYREALSNASPSTVLAARTTMADKPYYAEYRAQALENITNDRYGAQTFVTFANTSRMQPDEIQTLNTIVATNPAAARIVFGMDPNGGYSRRSASDGPYPAETIEAAARNMAQNDPRMAQVLARDSRYSAAFEAAGVTTAAVPTPQPAAAPQPQPEPAARRRETADELVARLTGDDGSANVTLTGTGANRTSRLTSVANGATAAALAGVDDSNGFSATEKQLLLEAAGRQTDGRTGVADGRVDGNYGTASVRAENLVRDDLAAGRLSNLDPNVLANIRAAFPPQTASGMSVANADGVNVSTVSGQGQNQSGGRGA